MQTTELAKLTINELIAMTTLPALENLSPDEAECIVAELEARGTAKRKHALELRNYKAQRRTRVTGKTFTPRIVAALP